MKPTLLLNPGTGWAATTPFYYTLALDNKYTHAGHLKENSYLYTLKNSEYEPYFFKKWEKNQDQHLVNENTLDHFSDEYMNDFINGERSIDKYIDYYKRHFEEIGRPSVADFSNYNISMKEDDLKSIADKLREHFNIKVTMQFREPVRRFFSETGSVISFNKNRGSLYNFKHGLDLRMTMLINAKDHTELFLYRIKKQDFSNLCFYMKNYKKFANVFGKENVLPIIMEKFWDPDQFKEQTERLSDFLNFKITKIHENVYFPDRGNEAPQLAGLPDQWKSDIDSLTDEVYDKSAKMMKNFIKSWENLSLL